MPGENITHPIKSISLNQNILCPVRRSPYRHRLKSVRIRPSFPTNVSALNLPFCVMQLSSSMVNFMAFLCASIGVMLKPCRLDFLFICTCVVFNICRCFHLSSEKTKICIFSIDWLTLLMNIEKIVLKKGKVIWRYIHNQIHLW